MEKNKEKDLWVLWEEQVDICTEIDNMNFLKRLRNKLNGKYGVARTMADFYFKEILYIRNSNNTKEV